MQALTLRRIAACRTLEELETVRLFALGKEGWVKQALRALWLKERN
jgi:hypothetical protein